MLANFRNPDPKCGKDPDNVSTNASGERKNKLRNISTTKKSLASTYGTMKPSMRVKPRASRTLDDLLGCLSHGCHCIHKLNGKAESNGRAVVTTEQALQAVASP